MKILHVVPGLSAKGNGMAVAAKQIAGLQGADLVETMDFFQGRVAFAQYDEVWVHSNWWPPTLLACIRVILAGKPLVRMTHANLDPLRYHSKWIRKLAVSFIERWIFRHASRVVVTCEAERQWCEDWGVRGPFEIFDLKQFYDLDGDVGSRKIAGPLHVLYLGRQHPLKGVKLLERAVREINVEWEVRNDKSGEKRVELQVTSDACGEELEKIWQWCDVLCLPTLSENFGLVVAEALERGKRVITTDGAPAWEPPPGAKLGVEGRQWWSRVRYLHGYRDGSDADRVKLLKDALAGVRF